MSAIVSCGTDYWRLFRGDWATALAGVKQCGTLLADPPYSAKTHAGYRGANHYKPRGRRTDGAAPKQIAYDGIDEAWARAFVAAWTPRVRNWIVLFGDHISNRWFLDALDAAGWCTFAPIPWVRTNAPPRFQGDGPASSCDWIAAAAQSSWLMAEPHAPERPLLAVARPRKRVDVVGSRPGWYQGPIHDRDARERDQAVVGGKPLWLMRALVRDYSSPGDLIVDPCAGRGTTLVAATLEHRRALGSELSAETYAKAKAWCTRNAGGGF